MLNIKFQYFPGKIYETKPLGEVTLKQFIESIRNPKESIKNIFKQIEECEKNKDWKQKAHLKQNNLFFFTPSVFLNGRGRSYSDIEKFLPLMVVEFDHVTGDVVAFRDKIFENLKSAVCGFISPSGAGVKFLVKIPQVSSVDEYKEYYLGICHLFENTKTFDSSNINPVLPLFLSWDETIRYRENPETWTIRGYKYEVPEFNGEVEEIENLTDDDKKAVLRICYRNIIRVEEEQVGHPNVKKCGAMLGNFVAAGYLEKEEAESYMVDWIMGSPYLSAKKDTYIKTAMGSINIGTKTPLYLKKHHHLKPTELKEEEEKFPEKERKYFLYSNLNEFKIVRS